MKLTDLLLILIIFIGGFFRFYQIDTNPPGLYIDEVSIGYNAYTILRDGQDEHSAVFPLFFKAFGEYKMPVYIYTTAGAMALFGKNEFSVRFTSALAGTLTILIIYLFIRRILEIYKNKKIDIIRKFLPATSAFLLAISTWHIHFSRGGFEVNLGILFFMTGLYLYILFWNNNRLSLLVSGNIFLILSMYTYNTFRIIAPVAFLIASGIFVKLILKERKKIIISVILFLSLCLPLLQFSFTAGGSERFAQTSAFSEYKAQTATEKIVTYPIVFLKNYISFFSAEFLFGRGDGNGRHQLPGYGLIYLWQFPFMVIGLWWLISKRRDLLKSILLTLLVLAPIPAAIVRPSPHSLRVLLMAVPFSVIIAVGLIYVIDQLRKWRFAGIMIISIVAIYELMVFAHFYTEHYPKVNALDWGAGNKELAQKAVFYSDKFDYIVVDDNLSFSEIYLKFYNDKLEFSLVDVSWKRPDEWKGRRVLLIRPYYGQKDDPKIIDQVYLPGNNKDIYAQFWNL
jgi:4-amino-4-deoxy-L-arabinose transferase-like glycosyltransferase